MVVVVIVVVVVFGGVVVWGCHLVSLGTVAFSLPLFTIWRCIALAVFEGSPEIGSLKVDSSCACSFDSVCLL